MYQVLAHKGSHKESDKKEVELNFQHGIERNG